MRAKKSLGLPRPKDLKTNKLEDIQNHFRLFREELDKQYRLLWQDVAVFQVDTDGAIYFGGKDTDGTWRLVRSGNDWNMERRESGTYAKKAAVKP